MAGCGKSTVGRLVAGIGIRPGTDATDILACLDEALAIAGLSGSATPRFATIASRIAEAGMIAAAADRSAELVAIPDEALKGFEAACATRSIRSVCWRRGVMSRAGSCRRVDCWSLPLECRKFLQESVAVPVVALLCKWISIVNQWLAMYAIRVARQVLYVRRHESGSLLRVRIRSKQ